MHDNSLLFLACPFKALVILFVRLCSEQLLSLSGLVTWLGALLSSTHLLADVALDLALITDAGREFIKTSRVGGAVTRGADSGARLRAEGRKSG